MDRRIPFRWTRPARYRRFQRGSVPDGVQFLWEGNDPGFVPGAKVAVYAGHTVGRAEPGDLSGILKLAPDLFHELATESFTIEGLEQRGGILQERLRIPRSARLKPVGTAAWLLELRRRHPELLKRILGGTLSVATHQTVTQHIKIVPVENSKDGCN